MLFANLLSKPFGPLDEDSLVGSEALPTYLCLTSVVMRFGCEHIGLDATEFVLPPGASNNPWQRYMNESDIRVFGVLQLDKLAWLSEMGHETLKTLMRDRDNEGRLPGSKLSSISPSTFYSDPNQTNMKISIVISFRKNMSAVCTMKDGLLMCKMFSESNQAYHVLAMQAECYKLSLNWFSRYQLFHLLVALVDEKKPVEERTIDWFVEQYRHRFRKGDDYRRIIFEAREDDTNIQLDGTVLRRRFLRHLASADLRGRFAEQCEWLLANQIASTSKHVRYFDTAAWVAFCKQVKRDRATARQNGEKWGIAPSMEDQDLEFPSNDPFGLERFGGKVTNWEEKLRLALKPPPQVSKKRAAPVFNAAPDFSAPKSRKNRVRKARIVKAIYDPDFSEDSTEGEPESDEWEPEIRVPAFCLQMPTLAPGRTEWHCPGVGCAFSVDLRTLGCPHVGLPVFRRKFQLLVSNHYTDTHVPAKYHVDVDIVLRSRESGPQPASRHRRSGRSRRIKREDS